MPQELREAHRENDRAIMSAYVFSTNISESQCVAELMKRRAQSRAPGVFYRVGGIAPVGRGRRRETRKRERIGAEGVAKRNAERDE